MITKRQVRDKFKTLDVRQIGCKQLFIVNNYYLISYLTVVGIRYNTTWVIANRKYSQTTIRQLTYFRAQHPDNQTCYQIRYDSSLGYYPINRDGSFWSRNKD